MKHIKTVNRIIAMLIISVMCFTLFTVSSSAVSLNQKGSISLTVLDKDSKEPMSGAVFRVYQIASAYEENGGISYVYTDEFKSNGMEMGNFSDAYLPVHLAVYAAANNIAYTEKATDSKGKVVFDNLNCGAYLVVPTKAENGYLNPSPFIAVVPMKDEAQNKWIYNIDATPKIEGDKDEIGEKTYVSVKKHWQSLEKTPDSVTVSLIKDGVVVETVILSAANNWYHRWDDLDKKHSWSVVETNVPEGYKVSYLTSEMTVIITNTATDYEEETTTTPEEDTTTPTDPSSPDDDTTTPEDTTTPDSDTTKPQGTTKPEGPTESTTKPEELIDTGMLNWPVPVFSIAGLLLFSIGWAMLNLGKKDEEAA